MVLPTGGGGDEMKFFKRLFCKHDWDQYGFIVYENGFGDTYTRGKFKCRKCGKKKKGRKIWPKT